MKTKSKGIYEFISKKKIKPVKVVQARIDANLHKDADTQRLADGLKWPELLGGLLAGYIAAGRNRKAS